MLHKGWRGAPPGAPPLDPERHCGTSRRFRTRRRCGPSAGPLARQEDERRAPQRPAAHGHPRPSTCSAGSAGPPLRSGPFRVTAATDRAGSLLRASRKADPPPDTNDLRRSAVPVHRTPRQRGRVLCQGRGLASSDSCPLRGARRAGVRPKPPRHALADAAPGEDVDGRGGVVAELVAHAPDEDAHQLRVDTSAAPEGGRAKSSQRAHAADVAGRPRRAARARWRRGPACGRRAWVPQRSYPAGTPGVRSTRDTPRQIGYATLAGAGRRRNDARR